MRFLTTNDIEIWADSVDCKYHLPHLVRLLILDTIDTNDIKKIHFAYGEDVQTGGYDGELLTEKSSIYIPLGESVWEFGTTNNKGKKANEDYEKRKEDTLGKTPSETTYINISCKKYRDKLKWAEEKQSDGFWKDVRYYDAIDIEQWLELSPTVELWLAERLDKPTLGIFSGEEYWKRWSESKMISIVPEILLGDSRRNEIEKTKSILSDDNSVLYIKSITKDEAIAFPLAIFKSEENLISRTVIIDNRESFVRFSQFQKPLIIITKFIIDGVDLKGAIQKRHKVIIPVSHSEGVNTDNIIQLPLVSRNTFEDGLRRMNIDSEQIKILITSSGRNISVLKRILKFEDCTEPQYIKDIDVKDFIPMLLLNRFCENYSGDKEVVERISGKNFSDYLQFLKIISLKEDAPVYHINGVWKLVSSTDAWFYFAKYVTKDNLELFSESCQTVLSEIKHIYTLPLEKRGNYILSPENVVRYSSKLREGVCESLAIICKFGGKYGLDSISDIKLFVDDVIKKTLQRDVLVWKSLSSNVMLLAEASPQVFLDSLEKLINDGRINSFFEVSKGVVYESNDLPSILWSLEIAAWFPESILRSSIILCELIKISPEKFPTTNTPINSLKNIYRIWYPQTNASADERKQVLTRLVGLYPEILFSVLYDLIKIDRDHAVHSPRPKWSLFSELREIRVSQNEVQYMRSFCLEYLMEMSISNPNKTILLIDLIDDIEWSKIDDVLKVVSKCLDLGEEVKKNIFHKFRKFISHHRTYSNANWSLPSEILNKIEEKALEFKPKDNILNHSFLFEEINPAFFECKIKDIYSDEFEHEVTKKRLDFVEVVVEKEGINKIFDLAKETKYPFIYGQILSMSDKLSEDDKFEIYRLIESDDNELILLVTDFIRFLGNRIGWETQVNNLHKLINSGLSNMGASKFLISLRDEFDLWQYIAQSVDKEIEEIYWKSKQDYVYPNTEQALFYALDKLSEYKKPITFLNTLGMGVYKFKNTLDTEGVLKVLEHMKMVDSEDSSQFHLSSIMDVFEFLYSKDDYDLVRGASIDFKFILFFGGSMSNGLKPKNLYRLISKDPDEYFEIFKQIYLSSDDNIREEELNELEEKANHQVLGALWGILNDFDQIPSMKDDGSINLEELQKWVDRIRVLAKNSGKINSADGCIGKLLARYNYISINESKGFPNEIYDIIENVNTDDIKNAFGIQISNNLGFTSRGMYEGGNIERKRAEFFGKLYEDTRFVYPNVSLIFKSIADGFSQRAKKEDQEAILRSLE